MTRTYVDPDGRNPVVHVPQTVADAVVYPSAPGGKTLVPSEPPAGGMQWDFTGEEWIPLAPTNDDVDAERQRRIDLGAEFTLTDGMVIAITGRQQDQTVLLGSGVAAQSMILNSITDDLVYRDRDNQIRLLTPAQMVELYQRGLAWITAIMAVSWAMKDGTGAYVGGIPADYTDDSHWPDPA